MSDKSQLIDLGMSAAKYERVHAWSKNKMDGFILDELCSKKLTKETKQVIVKFNSLFLSNLFDAYFSGNLLNYARGWRFYSNLRDSLPEKKIKFASDKIVTNLVDIYRDNDLIWHKTGFHNVEFERGKLSTCFPKGELKEKFDYFIKLELDNVDRKKKIPFNVRGNVEFRDENKIPIERDKLVECLEFPDDVTFGSTYLKELGKKSNKINEILNNSELSFLGDFVSDMDKELQDRYLEKHYLTQNNDQFTFTYFGKLTKRIFSNSSTMLHGRFYAPYQQFSKKTRNNFMINDNETSSVDIKACHLYMLYHMENIDYQSDPYELFYHPSLDTHNRCRIVRKINKKILQTILNAKDEKSAQRSVLMDSIKPILHQNGFYGLEKKFNSFSYSNYWIEKLKDKHERVEKYFLSGIGLKLMYIESEIISNTIIDLHEKFDTAAYPVHDELIVETRYLEDCKYLLDQNYKKFERFNNFDLKLN